MAKVKASTAAAITDPELKYIKLDDIIPDPNQPRRYFDEHQMTELFNSVKEIGVKQPVLVRPMEDKYMIVAGERRWRAAKAVKIHFPYRDSIPAMVEDLDDKQALEIQITENLQRADVKPMEEAVVFKSLIDSHNLKLEEIALRIGKSNKFVAQRLKLNDLIPDFQEMLERDIINLTDAHELARVSQDLQQSLLTDRITNWKGEKKDWRTDENFSLGNLYWIQNKQNSLSPAPFNVTDDTLNPSMGACTTCPHNSANNSILFEGEKAKCTHPVCFNTKKERSLLLGLQSAVESGMTIVVHDYSNNQIPETVEKYAKEEGIKILNLYHYSLPTVVEDPGKWEDYLEENKWWDEDDMKEEEFDLKQEISDLKETYDEEVEQYNQYKKEIEEAGQIGIPAFEVKTGETRYIVLNSKGLQESNMDSPSSPGQSKKEEINKIEVREIRAQQLDGEKVWTKVRELIPNNFNLLISEREFYVWMYPIVLRAITDKISWSNRDWIKDLLKIEHPGPDDITKALCALMIDALVGGYGSHLTKGSGNELMFKYIKFFLKDEVTAIELEHQEKAIKRQERVNKRILDIDPNYNVKEVPGVIGTVFTHKDEEE